MAPGIHVTGFDAVTVVVEDCVIEGNTGAGIRLQTSSRGAISGCTIDYNGDSGVYVFSGGEASISDCVIRGNQSPTGGGGIAAHQNARFDLTGSVVTGNLSVVGGGAYVSEGTSRSPPRRSVATARRAGVGSTSTKTPQRTSCEPSCGATAPTTPGDYTLELGSPCTAAESPCGLLIGALDAGSTPVRDVRWGEVKQRFGP